MKKFIELTVGNHLIFHGYDDKNQAIIEEITSDPMKKLIAIDRILSVSEKYVLTTGSHGSNRLKHGRTIYWEYEGDFDSLKNMFLHNQLLISESLSNDVNE